MTVGLKRYYGSNDLHFITCSCYQREPWLGSPPRRDFFLSILERVRKKYVFVVVGYVVMPEHFHLLMSEPQAADPSAVMQALRLGFARHMLAVLQDHRAGRLIYGSPLLQGFVNDSRHLWQARFYDFNVWMKTKRIEKLRYMHLNPVARGLVTEPDQWPWSSFRAYAYGERGPVIVNNWEILKMRVRSNQAVTQV